MNIDVCIEVCMFVCMLLREYCDFHLVSGLRVYKTFIHIHTYTFDDIQK